MKRIVIADDAGTARMFIKKCLEIVGFREAKFFEAANGKEAFKLIKAAPTDLLVTDINMPIMDGELLLKQVKSTQELKNIPVIVISSASNPAKEKELIALGAYGVLIKPVTPASLFPLVKPLL
ncbi:MAG: response regulator [bacterium]